MTSMPACGFCGPLIGGRWHNPACAESDLHGEYLAEVERYREILTIHYPDGPPADWLNGNRGDIGNEAALSAAREFNRQRGRA